MMLSELLVKSFDPFRRLDSVTSPWIPIYLHYLIGSTLGPVIVL